MELILESKDFNNYLKCTDIIDYNDIQIKCICDELTRDKKLDVEYT